MRRSKSSSNIPIPSFRRTLSSDNLRNSQHRLTRTTSSSHLAPPRITVTGPRSSKPSVSNLNRDYGGSNPNLAAASNRPGLSRRATATPLRTGPANSLIPSPAQALTTQKINDKKFSGDQFRKICAFLEDKIDAFDPKSLKALTLNTFVTVITILFKEIDPRINIHMKNYKEAVLKYLKLYKYPGPVSISLLKSANTSHSWPSVMAIFGWLVDLVNDLKEDCEDDQLTKFLVSRTVVRFRGNEATGLYINYIEEMLGLESANFNTVQSQSEKFEKELELKRKQVAGLQVEEQSVAEKMEKMTQVIKEFEEATQEIDLKKKMDDLKTQYQMSEANIAEMKEALKKTRRIISEQKYSYDDKLALTQRLEDIRYSLDLKREVFENTKKIMDEYDLEKTNFRRRIENEVHKINHALLQLKLIHFKPDAEKILLPDRGVHDAKFIQIIEEQRQVIQNFEEQASAELNRVKELFLAIQSEHEAGLGKLSKVKRQKAALDEKLEANKNESERIMFESDIAMQHVKKKLELLEKSVPDLESLENEKTKLYEELLMLEKKSEDYSNQAMEFFIKIKERMAAEVAEMRRMMAEITESSANVCEHLLQQKAELAEFMINYIQQQ